MTVTTKVAEGGRIVIPATYRKALGVQVGDEVILRLDADGVRVYTLRQAIQQAQAVVRGHVPEGRSLVQELIEERHAQSARE